jgi:hypothetical protein
MAENAGVRRLDGFWDVRTLQIHGSPSEELLQHLSNMAPKLRFQKIDFSSPRATGTARRTPWSTIVYPFQPAIAHAVTEIGEYEGGNRLIRVIHIRRHPGSTYLSTGGGSSSASRVRKVKMTGTARFEHVVAGNDYEGDQEIYDIDHILASPR